MTILPKKKHQESKRNNEQEHDNDHQRTTRQTRTRSSRDIRTRAQHSSTTEGLSDISESSNNRLVVGTLYNDLETRDSQDVLSLEHSHSPYRSSNYYLSQNNNDDNDDLANVEDEDDDLEDEEDGYNSSDEHGNRHQQGTIKKDPSLEKLHEREIEFERQLHEQKGFTIKQMATDGACMFRAVADQVYGDQEMHGVVRKHCMDYMVQNRDFFSQYITEDFTSYIRRKRNEHAHGNHIEMQALSEMYNRPIEVYQYSCEPINTFHSRAFYHDDNAPIRLSYHSNVHYNSIVDPYNPTVGVGLGLAGYKPGLTNESLNKAIKESEAHLLEKEMLQDKIKATDWEATDEQIAELAARESYLQWLKDTQKKSTSGASSSASSSTQTRRSPPREASGTHRRSPPHESGTHPRKSPSYENHRRSPPYEPSRRSPQYEHRKSPSYEHRKSPSYEHRKSPSYENRQSSSIENRNKCTDKKHSPSHVQRKSPPRDSKKSPSVETASNQQKESIETRNIDAANDWNFGLGYDLDLESDPVLAAVLAQSQQEYLDSLSRKRSDNRSATDTQENS